MQTRLKTKVVDSKVKPFRSRVSLVWRDKVSGIALRLSLGLNIVLILIIIAFFFRLPPQIPLFYSRPWGTSQLASSYFLIVIVALSLLVLIINTLLASAFYARERLISSVITWTACLVIFLITVTVSRVVFLIM